MKDTNEKYWELSEEEHEMIELMCGTIPPREPLLDIISMTRMAISGFHKSTEDSHPKLTPFSH